ncbi:MAG: hypothetical protein IPM82_03545 [Saprospiraceae bacterium]|nr:hypothetical protein [Saprospiraceae bacterium]
MKNQKVLLFLLPMFIVACKPIALVVSYSDDTTATGTVKIVPSRPLSGTKLIVDGKLLVENDSQVVKSITVNHIPDGTPLLPNDLRKLKVQKQVGRFEPI